MQDKTSLTLSQHGKGNEQRHFELKAGRELHVVQEGSVGTNKYGLSILALHDQGKRVYQFKKTWLVLALLAVAAMAAFPNLAPHIPAVLAPYSLYILAGLFFSGLLFLMLLIHTFKRSYVYYSIYTNLPLVKLWINNPTRKDFQHFITLLENNIKQHKQMMKIAYDKQLAGELRTLRRVTEAGMLSESVYLAAKAKLLLMSDLDYQPPSRQ